MSARELQLMMEFERITRHNWVVVLLKGKHTNHVVMRYAKRQVRKWKKKGLCSGDYITEWRSILENTSSVIQILQEVSPRGNRLRQNTPFAKYLTKFQRLGKQQVKQ